jgi:hypothetical protein
MSDEFVDVMLGKLVEALRPGPFDKLDEPTPLRVLYLSKKSTNQKIQGGVS